MDSFPSNVLVRYSNLKSLGPSSGCTGGALITWKFYSDFFFLCVVRCNRSLLYAEGVCLIVAVSLVQCPGWTFKAMST